MVFSSSLSSIARKHGEDLFLCTTTSPAPFCLFTELIAFMTYEAKFGATARMNLGLIAGSLVTFCFLLFGILRLVENDLFQM